MPTYEHKHLTALKMANGFLPGGSGNISMMKGKMMLKKTGDEATLLNYLGIITTYI
jgi:hypothetical protein